VLSGRCYPGSVHKWYLDSDILLLAEGLSIVRMEELARSDEAHPFTGGRSTFSDRVRRI
jgi:hypothetical protein